MAAGAQAQDHELQAHLVRALQSGHADRVSDAAATVLGIPVAEQGRGLRKAVADALVHAMKGGASKHDIERLVLAAAEIGRAGDAVVARAFALFPPTRDTWPGLQRAYQTLLILGEPALREVLGALASNELDSRTTLYALDALAYFAACWPVGDFSEETYSALRDRVVRTLADPLALFPPDGGGYPWDGGQALVSAVRAGVLLGDPEARAAIEELAADADAARARIGIKELAADDVRARIGDSRVDEVRRAAREGLADPRPHADLERDLASGDRERMVDAGMALRRIPVEMRSPALRQALMDAVLAEMDRPPKAKALRGFQSIVLEDEVLEIGRTGDPVAIPALVRSTAGWDAYEPLLGMAEPTLRWALGTLSSPDAREDVYRRALDALAYLVDHLGADAFDAESYREMGDHAVRTLNPHAPGWSLEFTPVWAMVSAIRLGLLLGDPEARTAVEELASTDAAVRLRGVTNPRWIAWIRGEAQEQLEDPRPPWRAGE